MYIAYRKYLPCKLGACSFASTYHCPFKFKMHRSATLLSLITLSLAFVTCQGHTHAQKPLTEDPAQSNEWLRKYGLQIDQSYSGPLSFSHLPYSRCLEDSSAQFDIALLGMPFDTGVSYRPGARFGPYGIRSGSRRQKESRGWTLSWRTNPYAQGSKIIDCGDVSVTVELVRKHKSD